MYLIAKFCKSQLSENITHQVLCIGPDQSFKYTTPNSKIQNIKKTNKIKAFFNTVPYSA